MARPTTLPARTVITFTQWSLDRGGRTPVSINPSRLDVVEFFSPASPGGRWKDDEAFPASSKIVNGRE
jgi:hypothetical protein